MFLDKFEAKVVAVDGDPIKAEDSYDFTLWSSGKVERSLQGKQENVTKEEIMSCVAMLGVHYEITPDEFRAAVEKAKAGCVAARAKLGQ